MDQQQIQVNHDESFCLFKSEEQKTLFNLEEYLRQQFKLSKFKLYYKEKDQEIILESEKQYEAMINKGQVKQLYLKEDIYTDKNWLLNFMNLLFPNEICCDNDYSDCSICLDKKKIDIQGMKGLVQECLYELIKKEDFQAFCKKQFKRNIHDVDQFLENFNKLSKPSKSILIPSSPKSQIKPNIQQSFINRQQQQSMIGKSIHQAQRLSQLQPKSQFIQQSKINQSVIRSTIIPQQYSVRYEDKLKFEKPPEYFPEKQITFEIMIINDGQSTWPKSVYLKQCGHHPSTIHQVSSLSPRETSIVRLAFQAPLNPGQYTFTWVLFYRQEDDDKETRIGTKWSVDFKIKDLPKAQKIEKSIEMIYNSFSGTKLKSDIKKKVQYLIDKQENISITQLVNIVIDQLLQQ